jgi:histidinol-phosphate aminotransferase
MNDSSATSEARSEVGSEPGNEVERLLRPDLRGRTAYGAPQLDVPVCLNTNESSYPVPDVVVRAALDALEDDLVGLNRYPDREFTNLRKALTAYVQRQAGVVVTPEQLWAGNGSNEVLSHLVQAFGGPGRTALGFTPSYSMHPIITETLGTTWVDGLREAETFGLTAAAAAAQARQHDPSIVFLCSPNNPTGTALPFDVIGAVLAAAPNAVVVVDEAYAEFARPGTPSALTLLPDNPRLVVTRTMSKAFAFAGGRLGYLVASAELVDALRLVRLPYHLSTPTQTIARVALEHAELMLSTVDAIKAQRDRIVSELAALGATPVPSDSNFVLFGGLPEEKATWQALLDRGILVRDVGIRHHLRVTAGTPQETTRFLAAMAELAPSHVGPLATPSTVDPLPFETAEDDA